MPIFKLSAPETMRLLSGHILPRNASNFTHSHLDVKKVFRVETHRPLLTEAGNWRDRRIKGSRPLKEMEGRKGQGRARGIREWKGGGGPAAGGSCFRVLGG